MKQATRYTEPLLILFFLIISSGSYSQHYKSDLDSTIEALRTENPETIIQYKRGIFIFSGIINDTCNEVDPQYLLWQHGSHSYIQKFANCFDKDFSGYTEMRSNIIETDNTEIYQLIHNHSNDLHIENLEDAIVKWKIGKKVFYEALKVSHPSPVYITIYTKDRIIRKQINEYVLEKRMFSKYGENVNYDYYHNSYLNKLKKLLEKEIERLEAKNVFVLEKCNAQTLPDR